MQAEESDTSPMKSGQPIMHKSISHEQHLEHSLWNLKVNYHVHKTWPEAVHIPTTSLQFTIYNPSIYTKASQGISSL
jgi:hypothetical protein